MKPAPHDHEASTRWIDGELDAAARAALDARLSADERAALDAAATTARELGGLLRDTYPSAHDVAGPDLFMHQLNHRIDRAMEPQATATSPGGMPLVGWLAAAAAVVLGIIVLGNGLYHTRQDATATHRDTGTAVLVASYVPDTAVSADSRYDANSDAVVIVLDGLEPVREPAELAAFPHRDAPTQHARFVGIQAMHRHRHGQSDS